jgi:hypothetical protein
VQIEPYEFIDLGEHVVVSLMGLWGGRDGVEVQARITWAYTLRDGAIERVCMFQEREEALNAVRRSKRDAQAATRNC